MEPTKLKDLLSLQKLIQEIHNWAGNPTIGLIALEEAVKAREKLKTYKVTLYMIEGLDPWFNIIDGALHNIITNDLSVDYKRRLEMLTLEFDKEIEYFIKNS